MSNPGKPSRMNATLNRALSAATRTSHASASAKPPPVAGPFTAAITGFDRPRSWVTSDAMCCWARIAAGGPPPTSAAMSPVSLRSRPAQKPRPAPVRIATLHSRSLSTASRASCRSSTSSRLIAFSRSGRSRVRSVMPSWMGSRRTVVTAPSPRRLSAPAPAARARRNDPRVARAPDAGRAIASRPRPPPARRRAAWRGHGTAWPPCTRRRASPPPSLRPARVVGRRPGGGGEGVVRFEVDHRPYGHPEGAQRVLEQRELRQQLRLDARARLVAGPHVVAERLDDVVRRHADMRRALLEQRERRAEHAPHGVDLDAVAVEMAGQREVVPEQLVGSVDEVDLHPRDASALLGSFGWAVGVRSAR